MQFAYKPGFAGRVPTASELQKALIFNDIGLEPTRGLRLGISKVRKTMFSPLLEQRRLEVHSGLTIPGGNRRPGSEFSVLECS
jgi:hypothetical protein